MTTTRGRADWRAAGACAQADPDLFFPISSAGRALGQIAKAKAVCAVCPVRQPCLEFALEHDLGYGIWGGTTPAERQARRMAAGPRSLSAPVRRGLLRVSRPGRVQTGSRGWHIRPYCPEWLITQNSFPSGSRMTTKSASAG